MPSPKKEKEDDEEEAASKKAVKRVRKRKRSKHRHVCRCNMAIGRVNKMFRNVHKYILYTVIHYPELTDTILQVIEKAFMNDIVNVIHPNILQRIAEKNQGNNTTFRKLKKSLFCRAEVHDRKDTFPTLNEESDGNDEESDGNDEENDEESDEGR